MVIAVSDARSVLPMALVAACCAPACKDKTSKPAPSPKPTGSARDAAAAAPSSPQHAGDPNIVIGKGLPAGAVARLAPPRFHSAGVIDDILTDTTGHVLTCSRGIVRLWEASSGRLLWNRVASLGNAVCGLSPDGRYIGLGQGGMGNERQTEIFDWKAGTHKRTTSSISHHRNHGFAFAPDGTQVGILQGSIQLWALPSYKPKKSYAQELAFEALFEKDGTIVAVGSKKVFRWKPDSGSKKGEVIATLPSRYFDADFSADGSKMAFATEKQVGVVDLTTTKVTPLALDLGSKPKHVALSPKGDLLAVATKKDMVSVWQLAGPTKLWQTKAKPYPTVEFSRDGRTLYYNGLSDLRIADARTGKTAPVPPRLVFVGWTPDNKPVAGIAKKYWVIDLKTGARAAYEKRLEPKDLPKWSDAYERVAGFVVAYKADQLDGCSPLKVQVIGKKARTLPKPRKCDEEGDLETWRIGPGLVVAQNSSDPTVWDAETGKKLAELDLNKRTFEQVAFSSDRKSMLVVLGPAPEPDEPDVYSEDEDRGGGTRFELWSLTTGKMISQLGLDKTGVSAVALSKDGRLAFVGWSDGVIETIDTATMKDTTNFGTQPSPIQKLELSPDGSLLAATDNDLATTIWRAAKP